MKQNKWSCTISYTLMQIATWGFYAVVMAFSSNVLYGFQFTDSQISLVLGASTVVAFVLQLVLAELVTRCQKLRVYMVLLVLGAVMLVGNLLVMMPQMPKAVAVGAYAVACMVLQMIPSFTNAIGMDAIERGSATNYSIARGMGSLGYSVLAYVTGILVRQQGVEVVPGVAAAVAVLLVVSVIWYHMAAERNLPDVSAYQKRVERKAGFLRQYPRFAIFLVAVTLLQFSHNLLSSFMFQIMQVKNGTAAEQGVATAISALVELPVMFFFPFMMRKLRCDKWVRIAGLAMALKGIGILMATTPYGVYVAQATQMVGYGLLTIASVNYARLVVGLGESVRAQSYLGSTGTVGSFAALSTGGIICQYWGAQSMVLVSLILSLLGGLMIVLTAQKTEF